MLIPFQIFLKSMLSKQQSQLTVTNPAFFSDSYFKFNHEFLAGVSHFLIVCTRFLLNSIPAPTNCKDPFHSYLLAFLELCGKLSPWVQCNQAKFVQNIFPTLMINQPINIFRYLQASFNYSLLFNLF